jgi:large subunit ribosomal protein L27
VKLFGGQTATSGSIIVRQKGNKYWAAEGTSTGRDFTIFATQEGKVKFTEKKRTRFDGRVYKDVYVSVV